jgi:hypothetical protein
LGRLRVAEDEVGRRRLAEGLLEGSPGARRIAVAVFVGVIPFTLFRGVELLFLAETQADAPVDVLVPDLVGSCLLGLARSLRLGELGDLELPLLEGQPGEHLLAAFGLRLVSLGARVRLVERAEVVASLVAGERVVGNDAAFRHDLTAGAHETFDEVNLEVDRGRTNGRRVPAVKRQPRAGRRAGHGCVCDGCGWRVAHRGPQVVDVESYGPLRQNVNAADLK